MKTLHLLALLLALVAPAAAQTVSRTNTPAAVALAWDPSTSAEVTRYRIYWGTAPGLYTNAVTLGNVTSATINSLVRGVKYYFAATALTAEGLESEYSNEVSYAVPALPGPPRAFRLVATLTPAGLALVADGDPGFTYTVEASTELAQWLPVAKVTADQGGRLEFAQSGTDAGARFFRARL